MPSPRDLPNPRMEHCRQLYHLGHQGGPSNCCCALFSRFSRVQLFAPLWTVTHQAPLSMGISRQEHWSGLPRSTSRDLPDPGIKPESPALQTAFFFFTSEPPETPLLMAAAAKSLQSCPTLCDRHGWQPTRLCRPWDSPGKNSGVGRHFLLPPNGSLVANNQNPAPLSVMIRESAFGTFMSFLFPHKGLSRYS